MPVEHESANLSQISDNSYGLVFECTNPNPFIIDIRNSQLPTPNKQELIIYT